MIAPFTITPCTRSGILRLSVTELSHISIRLSRRQRLHYCIIIQDISPHNYSLTCQFRVRQHDPLTTIPMTFTTNYHDSRNHIQLYSSIESYFDRIITNYSRP